MKFRHPKSVLFTAIASVISPLLAHAGTSTNTAGAVQQGTSTVPGDYANNYPAVTISLSGQAALRNFTGSQGISTLQPNSSATYYFGPSGTPVTYYAGTDPSTYVQLASKNFGSVDFGLGATSIANAPVTQTHSALRVEWHEQGSVQGLNDLINDQIGYTTGVGGTGIISNVASRGPSVGNPTWINNNTFTAGGTINGHTLSNNNYGDTYDTTVYNRVTGQNLQGGQNRIQYSQAEYKTEDFVFAGTPSRTALPGTAGYGSGNPALSAASAPSGLGNAGGRQSFFPQSYANQSTDKVDPESASNQTYAAGPWNTAGAFNIDSQQFAVNAVAYTANPGTGLTHINKGDGQWLLTTGRLQNGADFNVAMRANDAGQRTVPAVNIGVDPSWAVGENDDGNTSSTASQNTQKSLGAGIRFSGKTSGTEARAAIAQSRLGFGPLAVAEARGASSAAPIRSLDVDFNNLTDSGNPSDFKRANFDNIVNFDYKAVLISHINTIKKARPDLLAAFQSANPGATQQQIQTWWNGLTSAQTGIKGDQFGNVKTFTDNILNSVGSAAAGLTTAASANNPADALFSNGYLVPGLLNYHRDVDGGTLTPTNLNANQLALQQSVKNNYGPLFSTDGTAGSNAQTIGTSATYGALNAGAPAINTAIPITAKDASGNPVGNGTIVPKGNYLFGNFRQNGTRDFAAVKESLNAALSLHATDGALGSIYTVDGGVANNTVVPSLSGSPGWASTANTKGDLIVLGDYNSDGKFDGRDVYLLGRGASLADSSAVDTLSGTFADSLRNANAVLRKNAALDYFDGQLTAPADPNQLFIRQTASANLTNDPNGVNAFNKRDVTRDGLVNIVDAITSDKFFNQNYHNLDQTLAATTDVHIGESPKPQSLVDAELTDNGVIDQADLDVVNQGLTAAGKEAWAGTLVKSGAGSVTVNYTGGSFTVAPSAALQISAGTLNVGGAADPFTDNSGGGTNGNHVSIVNNSVTSLNITAGSKAIGALNGVGKTAVSIGATLAADYVRQNQLDVNGTVNIRPNGSNVSTVQTLNVGAGGKLNLADNDVVVRAGGAGTWNGTAYTGITGLVQSGRNGGAWNGSGITTSSASGNLTTLGVATASQTKGIGLTDTAVWNGQTVTGSDTLVQFTYGGDANLDGKINVDDYTRIDFNVPLGNTGWYNGDFNYDGKINVDDYTIIDFNVGIQGAPLGGGPAVGALSATAVPEPGSAGLLFTALGFSLARASRRRRR